MSLQCIVLDFDGTFTDVNEEAVPYTVAFQHDIADLLGRDISESWTVQHSKIVAQPHRYGMRNGGKIVVHANADPYVRSASIAEMLFDDAGILKNEETRATIITTLYRKAYRLTRTAFRPGARETLAAILETKIPAFVVTNSHSDMVTQKLKTLYPEGLDHLEICGDAQKFTVTAPEVPDSRFDALPEEKWLEGLEERPIYLQRGRYFDVLRRIWQKTRATAENTLICGDIFELDLAMPAELGARIHLVANCNTPDYEKDAVARLGPRGSVSDALSAILMHITT